MTDDIMEAEMQEDDSPGPISYNPFEGLRRTPGSMDRGVDYIKAKKFIEHNIRTEKKEIRYSCWSVMLIQLTNATRVSEAAEAWNRFLDAKPGRREFWIQVRKKKHVDKRRVLIPHVIEQRGRHRTPESVKAFSQRRGVNSHSLRYALIGYLSAVKQQPPQVIAKLTHHSTLNMILKYTQQHTADKILDDTAR